MDANGNFVEGGLKSSKAIAIWVPIAIAGTFFVAAMIGTLYLVITGKCSYCKRRRYNKKVEQYKKSVAAAQGAPPSIKGSGSNKSKSSGKKKKKNKNVQQKNGAIPNGGPAHATLPRNDVWQTNVPVMTPQGIMTSQGLVTSQAPPPYYVYSAPNYMTTLPNGGNAKHMVEGQNNYLKQGSKTLPRPAKLTTENLKKYQQENRGVILGKGQKIVQPTHGPTMNGIAHQPRGNGFATLPNRGGNRKANGHVGHPQVFHGQLLSNGHLANGHAKMNGQVPKGKPSIPPEVYPGEIYPAGVTHDALDVNGSLYPIKYVDDNGQTYIFVDDSQFLGTQDVEEINNNNSSAGMAVVNSNGFNRVQQPISGGPDAVVRVDQKVVSRNTETSGTASNQQKSAKTVVGKKYRTEAPGTAVTVSHPQLQNDTTSYKRDALNHSPKSKSSDSFTATASSSSQQTVLAAANATNHTASAPAMITFSAEDQESVVDFGTLTKEGGDREVKEVAVFMRWSPQLDKREIYNDGSMHYVATAHSSGSGGSSAEMATIMPQVVPQVVPQNMPQIMPQIVVTSEGDVTVPRNNMR